MVDTNRKAGVAFFIIGLLLVTGLWSACPNYRWRSLDGNGHMPRYIQIDAPNWSFPNKNITLKIKVDKLPVGPDEMKIYEIDYPRLTEMNAIGIAERHNFTFSSPPTGGSSLYVFTEARSNHELFVSDSAEIIYAKNGYRRMDHCDLEHPRDYIDMNAAEKIATEFIGSHGGMPKDAEFRGKSTGTIGTSDIVINTAYGFGYSRYIDDRYEVIGDWEGMGVTVNNTEHVTYFHKRWLSPYQSVVNTVEIHNSYEALQSISIMPKFLCINKTHEITSIELAYYNPRPFWEEPARYLRPVWVFHLDGSSYDHIVVDAWTLEQLKP